MKITLLFRDLEKCVGEVGREGWGWEGGWGGGGGGGAVGGNV